MQLWVKSSFSVILNGWTWFYRVYFWDAHTPDVLYNKDHINILGLHLFGFCFPFPRYIYWMLPIPFHFHGAPRGLSICCKDWPNMSLFPMGHSQSLGTWPDQRVGPGGGGRTAEKGKVQREQLTFQSLSWVHTLCTSLSSAGTCNILNSWTRLATLDYTLRHLQQGIQIWAYLHLEYLNFLGSSCSSDLLSWQCLMDTIIGLYQQSSNVCNDQGLSAWSMPSPRGRCVFSFGLQHQTP